MVARKELHAVMVLFVLFFLALAPVEAKEKKDKKLKPVPKAYASKHMPSGWWTDPGIIAEGKKIFFRAKLQFKYKRKNIRVKKGCSQCHAIDKKKDRPRQRGARDFRNATKINKFSDSYWFWRVSEGVRRSKMPAWKEVLSEEERWKAIAYEHTWSHGNKPAVHEHPEIQISVAP